MRMMLAAWMALGGGGAAAALAPSLVEAAPTTVSAGDQAAIAAFLNRLYATYHANKTRTWSETIGERNVYTADTWQLMRRNVALLGNEPGASNDADPICGCQDFGTIKVLGYGFAAQPDGRVLVAARIRNWQPTTRRIIMERTPAGWRVQDVLEPGYPSFRQAIIAENMKLAAGKR